MSDADLQHPAPRAVHAVLNALQIAIGLRDVAGDDGGSVEEDAARLVELLEPVAEDIAALQQLLDAQDGQLADLREEGVRMAQYIVRLEETDTKHLLTISELKTRLARAAEEIESLYALTNHEVGDATARHIAVVRTRDLLDLNMPIPVRGAPRLSAPAPTYAPPRSVAAGVK